MVDPWQLTRAEARRIAVRAQLLTADRPRDLLGLVAHLTVVQAEPTAVIAPSADLVPWSRLGPTYDPAALRDALDEQVLVEHQGFIRPTCDMTLLRAEMAAWPGVGPLAPWQVARAEWVEANAACHRDLLDRLRRDGPLPTDELPDSCEVPWRSTGWNDGRNVQMLLMLMVARGEVACVGRAGRAQLWDLAERVYPDEPFPDLEEARRIRDERRLAALGIARSKAAASPGERHDVGGAGIPAVVEGVRGSWRVDPALAGLAGAAPVGRAALLSPFDRLVQDRRRLIEIFEFEYLLEMYKPAGRRRWGAYALPILHGDRLVGKLEASADRAEGALVVRAVHQDEPFSASMSADVDAEIDSLARWLGLDVVRLDGR